MTFQQLQYVSEVAHYGSISKAAHELFISQSSVSIAIKALENEFKIQIFQRSPSGITLTEDGREFLMYARSLLDQRNHVENLFSKRVIKRSHYLNVVSQHLAFPPQSLVELMNKHSGENYEFSYRELLSNELLSEVAADHCDFGIIFLSDVMKRLLKSVDQGGGIEFHEMCRVKPKACVRKGHPLAAQKRVTMEELTSYPYMAVYQDYSSPFDHVEEVRLNSLLNPKQRIFTTDRATIYDVLGNSDACIICTGIQTKTEAERTQLIPIEDYSEEMRLGWIKLKRKVLHAEACHFLDGLNQWVQQWFEASQKDC